MSKRLEILENSLKKKEAVLDEKFKKHFESVKAANGQPLNDKRNGQSTQDRWERQSDSIQKQKDEINKTKRAIELEQSKISRVDYWYNQMPDYVKKHIDSGNVKQWRKHPRIMFVDGVDSARLVFDDETGLVTHRYVTDITNQSQYSVFRDVFNDINICQKKHQKEKPND